MISQPALQNVLNWASLGLSILLVLRLVQQGLHKTYRWFFVLLLFDAVRTAALMPLRVGSNAYGWVYIYSAPLVWITYLLVLRELYEHVLTEHKGLASAGSYAVHVGLAAAVVLSVALSWADLSNPDQQFPILNAFFVFNRVVVGVFLLLLLIIAGFLLWFPVRLSRNVVYYCIGYVIFFLSKAVLLLFRNVIGSVEITRVLSTVNLLLGNLILLFWIFRLNRHGQDVSQKIGHSWNPEQNDHLVKQLDSINEALLRAARR